MARNKEIPELLERFMEDCGETERWITVNEFRTYFDLDELYSPAISGFFRRIYQGSFYCCPYRVERIEKTQITTPQRRYIKRYLVKIRPGSARQRSRRTAPVHASKMKSPAVSSLGSGQQ